MCLIINNLDESNKEIARLRKIGKPVVAWKVALVIDFDDTQLMYAAYQNIPYTKGLNVSNRKQKKLTEEEINTSEVYEGFHCFLQKGEAYEERYSWGREMKVIKVTIDPKDLIAYGKFGSTDCLVCTKMTI